MSQINEIITRVVADDEFKNEFLADPMKATEAYELTVADVANLRAIDIVELSLVNQELEERLSKSFINLPTYSLAAINSHGNHSKTTHANHGSHNKTHTSAAHGSW